MAPSQPNDPIIVDYILRYGGRCRGCADSETYPLCEMSGLPCKLEPASKAVQHVINALRYGISHGFIDNPFHPPSPSMEKEAS